VSDNITLPRELVQETLEALERYATDEAPEGWHAIAAITALRARLAAPRPEPGPWWCVCKEADAAMQEDKT
jgi:hypothetical protein